MMETPNWSDVLLSKVKFRARTAVAPYVLRNARASVHIDEVLGQMIFSMDSHVLAQEKTSTHRIVEEPVYRTWKHHLVASLPQNSFRQRYMRNFFHLEDEPLSYRVVHTVTASAYKGYPEAGIELPRDRWGDPYLWVAIHDSYLHKAS